MTSKYAYLIVVLAPFLFVNSRLGVKQGKDIAVMNEENLEQEENLKEEAPKEEEKLFTQEEVNEIIRHRLHERKKAQEELYMMHSYWTIRKTESITMQLLKD